MAKRCWKCKHFLKEDWKHRLCRKCRKLVRATVKVVKEAVPKIYMGKKAMCELCEEITYLWYCKCFNGKLCQECKTWCEVKLKGLPKGDATF